MTWLLKKQVCAVLATEEMRPRDNILSIEDIYSGAAQSHLQYLDNLQTAISLLDRDKKTYEILSYIPWN